ncbi:MAG: hypothetical protein ACRDKE_08045 [Solirubrobacterales bacterium]
MNVLLAADTGGSYVAAAYLVFLVVLLIYVAIMANKLVKMQRSLSDLTKNSDQSD